MTGREPITIGMTIWVHSHYKTKEPLYWEWFSITGENIPIDMFEYLMDKECLIDDLDAFSDLETEKAYYVVAIMENAELPGDWYVAKLDGYHIVPDPYVGLTMPSPDRGKSGPDR